MKGIEIKSILAACDFSQDANYAAQRGSLLAEEHSAGLRLMTVVRETLLTELGLRLSAQGDAVQRVVTGATRDLEALAARLGKVGEQAERLVVKGDVVNEIVAAADYSELLVLGAHGLNPLKDVLIGTTAERMLRKSRRPMLVVRNEPRGPYQRVLVAVDFSMPSLAALEFAAHLAPGAQLHIFHAFEFPLEGMLRRADVTEMGIRALETEFRDHALANVRNLLELSSAFAARTTSSVAPGNARNLVPMAAEEWSSDLVVLGKHGHSAVGEYFLGGVTRHVLSKSACDVCVVPDQARP